MPELGGVRSTVSSPSWADRQSLRFVYALEWTAPNTSWELNDEEPLTVFFWSQSGSLLNGPGGTPVDIPIDPAFRTGKSSKLNAPVTVQAPPQAASVSVALGRSGLETAPTPLPPRP